LHLRFGALFAIFFYPVIDMLWKLQAAIHVATVGVIRCGADGKLYRI
jgi:hypothetical protein